MPTPDRPAFLSEEVVRSGAINPLDRFSHLSARFRKLTETARLDFFREALPTPGFVQIGDLGVCTGWLRVFPRGDNSKTRAWNCPLEVALVQGFVPIKTRPSEAVFMFSPDQLELWKRKARNQVLGYGEVRRLQIGAYDVAQGWLYKKLGLDQKVQDLEGVYTNSWNWVEDYKKKIAVLELARSWDDVSSLAGEKYLEILVRQAHARDVFQELMSRAQIYMARCGSVAEMISDKSFLVMYLTRSGHYALRMLPLPENVSPEAINGFRTPTGRLLTYDDLKYIYNQMAPGNRMFRE